ncbi:hypothetical protein V8C35DRAFT_302565 [Trichoderma chlorosporum]
MLTASRLILNNLLSVFTQTSPYESIATFTNYPPFPVKWSFAFHVYNRVHGTFSAVRCYTARPMTMFIFAAGLCAFEAIIATRCLIIEFCDTPEFSQCVKCWR